MSNYKAKSKLLLKYLSKYTHLLFVSICLIIMIVTIYSLYAKESITVEDGVADLRHIDFQLTDEVSLRGNWDLYWDQLLLASDFKDHQPPNRQLAKVPGAWSIDDNKDIPNQGIATYRLVILRPEQLEDPAIRIQNVSTAYKVYANGELFADVGRITREESEFIDEEKLSIIALPSDTETIELLIQVGNQRYRLGGLRLHIVFGSKETLDRDHMFKLVLEAIFSGGVFIFGIYYLLVFFQQRQNLTALIFSLLCILTAIRVPFWGESMIEIFFPHITYQTRTFFNYLTGYNLVPLVLLFVFSLYPGVYKKWISLLVLAPSLLMNMLLFTNTSFASHFTSYAYLVMLFQMFYLLLILIKAVLIKLEDAKLIYVASCIYVVCVIVDIMQFMGIGDTRIPYMFLFGNISVLIFMSLLQAKRQANDYKKVLLYNQQLIESDELKDKIMATELSFLQAQIKPHFLNNALNAIANVCEKDGIKASKLIIDLAMYLRGSLEFNNINKKASIDKELEFVDTYFHIEQARFGDKIQLFKEVSCPLDMQIPILILQPLVENAIRHGISKRKEGGSVWIRIEENNGEVIIEIEDNGVGIAENELNTLLSEERLDKGVGLININLRLQRVYGESLEIVSKLGQGTKVSFRIGKEINRR